MGDVAGNEEAWRAVTSAGLADIARPLKWLAVVRNYKQAPVDDIGSMRNGTCVENCAAYLEVFKVILAKNKMSHRIAIRKRKTMIISNAPHLVTLAVDISPGGVVPLGSCFEVRSGIFATAAHVVTSAPRLHVLVPASADINDYQDTSSEQYNFTHAEVISVDPIRDIALIKVPAIISGPNFNLGSSDTVSVGDTLVTLGFPHADFGRVVLTHFDVGVGARTLVDSRGLKLKHLVLNTQARKGQSGGPVLNQMGIVVAMLVGSFAPKGSGGLSLGGIDPHTLHQTTHAISAEYIAEMLADV